MIIAGIGSIFTKNFDLGVDFRGGYSYTVQFAPDSDVDIESIREATFEVFQTNTVVKSVDVANTYNIVTSYLVDDTDDDATDRVMLALYNGINSSDGGVIY